MIDARNAVGVPVITDCPILVNVRSLGLTGDLTDWQRRAMSALGIELTQ